ncbi:MAG: GIY-YIG nuclease family protein [Flavobacteriaceae bacterium]
MLTNKNSTVLYIGYTEDLKTRIVQHKNGNGAVFTKKYSVYDLIYFEEFDNKKIAQSREKQLKNWHKAWEMESN